MNPQRYPIGQQDFANIRKEGKVYVDKTELIYNLVNGSSNYIFLSRPRRFGKSLLLSTIQAYFEGEKELFDGLAITGLEKNWVKHPVLHLELSRANALDPESLKSTIDQQFVIWEKKYDVEDKPSSLSARFANIIITAHERTGQRVVILIDEYDNPLINSLHHDLIHESNRELLKAIYSNLKALDRNIRFAMLTGVSRFTRTSIFSGLNNLTDVTFSDRYSSICGFTLEEINKFLVDGVSSLAKKKGVTLNEAFGLLKDAYDGYHFSQAGEDIYNPFSLMKALEAGEIKSYWVETATPEFLVKKLKGSHRLLESIFNESVRETTLREEDTSSSSPVSLLFQTGYLTIKSYDPQKMKYRLGIPNREIEHGLFEDLLVSYTGYGRDYGLDLMEEMSHSLQSGSPEDFLSQLRSFLSGIPGIINPHRIEELNLENTIYVLMKAMGKLVQAEQQTSSGRIDLLIKTSHFIYILELKIDKTAQEALDQIKRKEYDLPYRFDGRKIFNIGVNFSSQTRNITDWLISTP